ncbi:MAG: phosphoribosyltransferase family protein [Maricaulaceae bacterium]
MGKIFISADELLQDSFRLALKIFESGYRPTFIVGVWRGGAPIGIAVQEILEALDCPTDHIAIRTSSYGGGTVQDKTVKVYGVEHLIDHINHDDKLLIVDDTFDSGRSVAAIIDTLKMRCRLNMPKDVRIATVYFKPTLNQTERVPDFYLHETDEWLVFPHELRGCTKEELKTRKKLPVEFQKYLEDF